MAAILEVPAVAHESMPIDKHYKTEPLAELLGISPDTLRRAAQRGELRPVVIGRDFLWSETEVLAWLDRQRMVDGVKPRGYRRGGKRDA